jgi:transposase-like protein
MNEEIHMKMTRYSELQILAILRQAEGGAPVAELCRKHGMMPLPGKRFCLQR